MATYNGNGIYLSIGGVVMDAYFKSVELTSSLESVDVTAGSNSAHRERAEGLADTSMSVTLVYDSATLQSYVQKLRPGTYPIIFGPEGNTAGKPKHVQDMILTEAPFSVEVEKAEVAFQLSFEAAAAPSFSIFNGAVF